MTAKTRIILKRFFIISNVLLSCCLLLLYALPYVNQSIFWFINLFAITLPFLLLAQLCFLVLWLFFKSKWGWAPVITLLLSWNFITALYAFKMKEPVKTGIVSDHSLRITTWNVHLFNIPFYKTSLDSSMLKKIKELNPDILTLQEIMYAKDIRHPFSLDSIMQALGFKYHAAGFEEEQYRPEKSDFTHCGVIFSKHPIIAVKTVNATDANNSDFLYADIKVKNDTIRVFNFHLQSLLFTQQDYNALSDVRKGKVENVLPGGKAILKKMKIAYAMRAQQVNNILPGIENSPYPVVVCGDFNDVPASYTYQKLSHNLLDAQREAGKGIGRSFKFISPTLRIDYILSDERISPVNAFIDRNPASDHFPFTADFQLK